MAVTYLRRDRDHIDLGDVLDRLLNAGVVAHGSIVVRVAGIDLIYIELRLVAAAVEKMLQAVPLPRRLQ